MNVKYVNQIDSPELAIYSGLSEPRLSHYYEPEPGLFIAETLMVISRALDAGYLPESFLVEDQYLKGSTRAASELSAILQRVRAEENHIPVYTASSQVLNRITGYALTRGVLCAMRRKTLPASGVILNSVARIAVLENVMNPSNLGSIFRSAAALGMDAVLLTSGCTDPLYRRAVRVSVGTVFQIPWTYLESWPEGIGQMHSLGYRVAAMALREDSVSLQDFHPEPGERIAFVMGSEGPGLMQETLDACDLTVRIPMSHGVDSLNVAAASALAFWQIRP